MQSESTNAKGKISREAVGQQTSLDWVRPLLFLFLFLSFFWGGGGGGAFILGDLFGLFFMTAHGALQMCQK